MDTTSNQGFPKPELTDPPHGPEQIGGLADALDAAWPVRSKGKSVVATEQSANGADVWQMLGTPDRVQDLVLPADGLLHVAFWGEVARVSGTGSVRVGLFLNGEQVRHWMAYAQNPTLTQASVPSGNNNLYRSAYTHSGGLEIEGRTSTKFSSDPTTGLVLGGTREKVDANDRVVGGPVTVLAEAGTYDVSIRYYTESGNVVKARNRKLWAWTVPF